MRNAFERFMQNLDMTKILGVLLIMSSTFAFALASSPVMDSWRLNVDLSVVIDDKMTEIRNSLVIGGVLMVSGIGMISIRKSKIGSLDEEEFSKDI